MSTEQQPPPPLREISAFLEFLKGLWARLASVSVLFPLSNVLLGVIPMGLWPDGGFIYFSKPLVTAFTTLACLFVVLALFARRERIVAEDDLRTAVRRATVSLLAGFTALAVYLVAHFLISQDFYFHSFGWQSDDPRRIAGDLLLTFTYVAFFALVTRAFLLLALREYMRQHPGTDA